MSNTTKCYGSMLANLNEVRFVLASGVYVTYRLERDKSSKSDMFIVDRSRVRGQKHDLEIHPTIERSMRDDGFAAIMAYRAKFRLPEPPVEHRYKKPFQLSLVLR